MKAVIVEDEQISVRRMQRLLESRGFEILEKLGTVKDLLEFIDSGKLPDVFFLDIHLSDGIVFDALVQKKVETPIIFTTAFDQYAIKAFKQNSVDYILKPIDEDDLDAAIDKFKRQKSKQLDVAMISQLLNSSGSEKTYRQRITVKVGDKLRSFTIAEVVMFYSSNKMNYLFAKDGRSYPIDQKIEELSGELNPNKYFRVNRGQIISIDQIKDIAVHSNSRLKILIDGTHGQEIIVSREKVKDFKKWLG